MNAKSPNGNTNDDKHTCNHKYYFWESKEEKQNEPSNLWAPDSYWITSQYRGCKKCGLAEKIIPREITNERSSQPVKSEYCEICTDKHPISSSCDEQPVQPCEHEYFQRDSSGVKVPTDHCVICGKTCKHEVGGRIVNDNYICSGCGKGSPKPKESGEVEELEKEINSISDFYLKHGMGKAIAEKLIKLGYRRTTV